MDELLMIACIKLTRQCCECGAEIDVVNDDYGFDRVECDSGVSVNMYTCTTCEELMDEEVYIAVNVPMATGIAT